MPKLKLDVVNATCGPGATIVGTIRLRGHHNLDVSSLRLRFSGNCWVYFDVDKYSSLFELIPIVQDVKYLPVGAGTVSPGHFWRFEYTVPSLCAAGSNTVSSQNYMSGVSRSSVLTGIFNTDGPEQASRFDFSPLQALPPSFAWLGFTTGLVSAITEYKLTATVSVRKRRHRTKTFSARKPIKIIAIKTPNDPPPQTYSPLMISDKKNAPQLEGHQVLPLCFKSRKGSPSPDTFLDLEYPTVGVAEQQIRLTLSLRHDLKSDRKPSAAILQGISIKLVTRTLVRTGAVVNSVKRKRLIGKVRHLKEPLEKRVEVGDLMPLILPKGLMPTPTFATPNISRSYYFSFKITVKSVEHRGKKNLRFHSGELLLLPA